MQLKHWLALPFKFNPIPVSVLTILIYGLVFSMVLVTDNTPDVPKKQGGLNLSQAYRDLHMITARPHPYTSHANDDIRDYLLSRLQPIVDSQIYVHLSDDTVSNASFSGGQLGVYFEGTNILVKVDGTDASALEPDGVLFSAHYDSVPTGPGATDNGMGVATLLQLVEYFANPDNRPRRTAVFLFNNGEEDGLNGAHLYYEHRWSNLTNAFINLEGAASGGRPVLFQATSQNVASAFRGKGVSHPHGTVLSSDAFARGVIRSRTDYEVFTKGIEHEKPGMAGLNLAFYKNRAFYHTPRDSVPGMGRDEGRKSLWAMMESTLGAGLELLNGDIDANGGNGGVYFDLLGRKFVVLSLKSIFVWNVVFLVVGPLSVLGMLAWVIVVANRNVDKRANGHEPQPTQWERMKKVLGVVMGWGRFWLTLLIAIFAHVGIVAGYVKTNSFIIHSSPYLVLTTALSFSYLTIVIPLQLFEYFWPSPPSPQKFAIILETYFLAWVFLVIATVAVNKAHIGGVYLVTIWYFCTWLAAVLGLGEAIFRAEYEGGNGDLDLIGERIPEEPEPSGHRFVRGIMYQAEEGTDGAQAQGEPVETDPTEITPLMQQHRRRSQGGHEYVVGIDGEPLRVDGYAPVKKPVGYEESGWWILQMVSIIPLPTILIFQILILLLHALRNTMVDGSSAVIVYGGLYALSLLVFISLSAFAHRLHRTLNLLVILVFIVTLIYSWSAFPFTQDAPLKVFFQQRVELDLASGSTQAATFLTAPRGWLENKIIRELPSSWGKDLKCQKDEAFPSGLWTCSWESNGLSPSPGGDTSTLDAPYWLKLETERLNTTSARFRLKGQNTRGCKLHFNRPIRWYQVEGSTGRIQPGYEIGEKGVKELRLWSREWENEFVVDVGWGTSSPHFTMEGRAACIWAEYASATAGSPHTGVSAQVPALEEVMQFLPLWAISSVWARGIVEVWTKFAV